MNILPAFRQTKEIMRAASPDQLIDEHLPVLYNGIMNDWASYPKWNIQYLVDKFGQQKISADHKVGNDTTYIHTSIAAYAEYIRQAADDNPYYAKSTLHIGTSMEQEYQTPPAFNCWYKSYYKARNTPRKITLSCLYFGPRGARSTLHRDIWGTSFWNALYEGRKLWLFFPRDQEHLLYNGDVDPLNAEPAKFPLFFDTTPIVCIQEPGEIIYCPGNIWHWAYVLEPGLALSENFINKDNYQNVLQYFHNVGYTNAAQKMEDITRIYLHQQ